MKYNQKGFTVVEVLLVVIALTLIVGTGFYVMNARKDKADTTTQTTQKTEQKSSTTPVKKVDTQGALTKAQEVYDTYYNTDYTKGRVATGPYKDSNPIGQLYLNYIQDHREWFSDAFVSKAETTVKSGDKDVLICFNGSAMIKDFKATLVGEKDGVVQVNVTGEDTGKSLVASLKQVNGAWIIDSADYSGCQ